MMKRFDLARVMATFRRSNLLKKPIDPVPALTQEKMTAGENRRK